MKGKTPQNIILFRIIHKDNVEFLLKNGMFTKNHLSADTNYINIGDNTLISQRNDYPVGINPPGGNLGDYVPFYFGPLSPMLLNIKTGFRGVTKRPQSDIVYICCDLNLVIKYCADWCFTDGHAKSRITGFYNNIRFLDKVDWKIVAERYWKDNEEDYDRARRKQAEFLVKEHVPVACLNKIIVYDSTTHKTIKNILDILGLQIPVEINPDNQYYYL
jgi:hypothetical protein